MTRDKKDGQYSEWNHGDFLWLWKGQCHVFIMEIILPFYLFKIIRKSSLFDSDDMISPTSLRMSQTHSKARQPSITYSMMSRERKAPDDLNWNLKQFLLECISVDRKNLPLSDLTSTMVPKVHEGWRVRWPSWPTQYLKNIARTSSCAWSQVVLLDMIWGFAERRCNVVYCGWRRTQADQSSVDAIACNDFS